MGSSAFSLTPQPLDNGYLTIQSLYTDTMPPPSTTNHPLNLQASSFRPWVPPLVLTITQLHPATRPIPKPLVPNSKASFPPRTPSSHSDISAYSAMSHPHLRHLRQPIEQHPRNERSPRRTTSRPTAASMMSSGSCDRRVAMSLERSLAVLDSMEVRNHEKRGGGGVFVVD